MLLKQLRGKEKQWAQKFPEPLVLVILQRALTVDQAAQQFCTQSHSGRDKEQGYRQFALEKWISLELCMASNPHVGKR